jgi:hypothetical protein
VRDPAVRLGHVLGDLAAKADDLDRFVGALRRGAASGDASALVKDERVEVGVADPPFARLYLAEVDSEIASASTDGGRGEDVGGSTNVRSS